MHITKTHLVLAKKLITLGLAVSVLVGLALGETNTPLNPPALMLIGVLVSLWTYEDAISKTTLASVYQIRQSSHPIAFWSVIGLKLLSALVLFVMGGLNLAR